MSLPDVRRRGDDRSASAVDLPAADRPVESEAEHRPIRRRRQVQVRHRTLGLHAGPSPGADLTVMSRGLMLVAVVDGDLQRRAEQDASGESKRRQPEQPLRVERRRVANGGVPHVRPCRPVRAPRAEGDRGPDEDAASQRRRPLAPSPAVDCEGEWNRDDQRRPAGHESGYDDERLGDDQVELVPLGLRGLRHRR